MTSVTGNDAVNVLAVIAVTGGGLQNCDRQPEVRSLKKALPVLSNQMSAQREWATCPL